VRKEVFLGPLINEAAVRTFTGAAAEAERDGRVLTGGRVLKDGELAHGHFVEPTLVAGLPPGHRLEREELFVPFLVLAEVESLDEAIGRANDAEYGLTAGIFSEDEGEVQRFLDEIQAGVTYANRRAGATTGAWPGINPFGGPTRRTRRTWTRQPSGSTRIRWGRVPTSSRDGRRTSRRSWRATPTTGALAPSSPGSSSAT
jgi:1-pyrroline-5-carboxylate dehydrogenase